jgi:hypothetical protein
VVSVARRGDVYPALMCERVDFPQLQQVELSIPIRLSFPLQQTVPITCLALTCGCVLDGGITKTSYIFGTMDFEMDYGNASTVPRFLLINIAMFIFQRALFSNSINDWCV